MLTESTANLLTAIYRAAPSAIPLLDFLVKSFVLLALTALVVAVLNRRLASSSKHLLWKVPCCTN